MAIFSFQKPDKVIMIDSTDFKGKFEFKPLESGYGWILGYALRHVLLSSFEGYIISSVRIEGVEHMFSTIFGVVEDVTEIILNLKQVRLKSKIEDVDNEFVFISFSGKDKLVAGDLDQYMSSFQVLNPDFVICNLDSRVTINMKLKIEKGLSYVSSEENRKQDEVIGTFFTDSICKPVKNVKYAIENFRVGEKSDYEKLVLEIITDGTIHPKDALAIAAKTLIHHFILFSDSRVSIEADKIVKNESYDEDLLRMKQLLKTKLVDMSLSARVLNCLRIIEVETLEDLVSFKKTDLIKIRNLGKKSLAELDELVAVKGLNFGMELGK